MPRLSLTLTVSISLAMRRAYLFLTVASCSAMAYWEGLRVHHGKVAFLDQHLDRLYEGAKALDMDMEVSPRELAVRIERLLEKNAMHEGVHIRLMVSRGIKATPYQDPRITITPPTIVIIPEYKEALPETAHQGYPSVYRARAPRLSRRSGSETQQSLQIELYNRLQSRRPKPVPMRP